MSQPSRPTAAITYEQAVAYESSPVKWISFHGHITNVCELSRIFKIHHQTLVMRLRAGWHLEAALIADKSSKWNVGTMQYLQDDPRTIQAIKQVLDNHFNPKSKKVVSGKKGG